MGRSDNPADEHQNRQDHGHKSKDINILHRGPHHHSNPSLRAFAHDLPSDPTDFEGQAVLWDDEGEDRKRKTKGTNAVQGASAAGVRAITTQLVAFYFRYPVKAFMRLRVDYLAVARAINPAFIANEPWSLRLSSFGLIHHAVKHYGWRFIPNQVLPPLLANTAMGALVYTSYLQILQARHEPAGHSTKRSYPPPPMHATFAAGAAAGALQSLFAAPLDAISARFDAHDYVKNGNNVSFWKYGQRKLSEIGLHGVFAGYSLSLTKEALGYGFFFASFEYVKQQSYYSFLSHYYGHRHRYLHPFGTKSSDPITIINPHWALEPTFLLFAGTSASFASQAVFHPLNQIQSVHLARLDGIDRANSLAASGVKKHTMGWWTRYSHAYEKTFLQCREHARASGGWRPWLYQGYLLNTIKSTPSTAAALIVFELVRRKFGEEVGLASIQHDGFEIVL